MEELKPESRIQALISFAAGESVTFSTQAIS